MDIDNRSDGTAACVVCGGTDCAVAVVAADIDGALELSPEEFRGRFPTLLASWCEEHREQAPHQGKLAPGMEQFLRWPITKYPRHGLPDRYLRSQKLDPEKDLYAWLMDQGELRCGISLGLRGGKHYTDDDWACSNIATMIASDNRWPAMWVVCEAHFAGRPHGYGWGGVDAIWDHDLKKWVDPGTKEPFKPVEYWTPPTR